MTRNCNAWNVLQNVMIGEQIDFTMESHLTETVPEIQIKSYLQHNIAK